MKKEKPIRMVIALSLTAISILLMIGARFAALSVYETGISCMVANVIATDCWAAHLESQLGGSKSWWLAIAGLAFTILFIIGLAYLTFFAPFMPR